MKITGFVAALISAASVNGCLVDGHCGCALDGDFYHYQLRQYDQYRRECHARGVADELAKPRYDPWAAPTSKYAYADYVPGENPYLGRWRAEDNGMRYTSYSEAMHKKTK